MTPAVDVGLLGGVVVRVDGHVMREPVPGPLGRLAFAYLLLHRHRLAARDELAEALWGEKLPPSWESALRGVVFRLRRALSAAGLPGPDLVESLVGCYALRLPPGATVDVEQVATSLDTARRALVAGLLHEAHQAAADAVAISEPDFLPGAPGTWAEQRQADFRQVYLSCLEVHSQSAAGVGDYAAAAMAAEQAIAREPFRESAHVLLIKAHYGAGKRAQAVRAYERCKDMLRRELGVSPSTETVALYRSVLGAGEEEARSPILRSAATNLPTPMSSFVGREGQYAELLDAFDHTRLLTLTGPGGVGKSRLALELGQALLGRFPDGVWLVELANVTAPDHLARHVLSALRLSQTATCTPGESLARCLAERRSMIILDNCEHLLEACASLVGDLLSDCAGLCVLITSREPLRLSEESLWRVPLLEVPQAEDPAGLEEAMSYDSVRLFADRVLAASPRHPLQPVAAIARICRQLDGLPLALELAAAHARLMPLEDIARCLEDDVPVFVRSLRSGTGRHRTLHDALDWSHNLLSESEQALFAGLSVFRGGFTLTAVEAVFPEPNGVVVERLSGLVDKSLVLLESRAGTMRYRLLETARQYAEQRLLEEGRTDEARAAHLDWFTCYAQSVEAELEGPLQDKWLDTLEFEHDNLRAALEWAHSSGSHTRGCELALALGRFWEVRGYLTEGRWSLETAAHSRAESHVAARCLNAAGVLAHHQCDYASARRLHDAALAAFDALGDLHQVAVARNGLANIEVSDGNLAKAKEMFAEVIATGRVLEDQRILAAGLLNVGVVIEHLILEGQLSRGEASKARMALSEALDIYREQGNIHGIAVALENIGVLLGIEGDDESARRYLAESLAISRHLGNLKGIAGTVRFLGQLAFRSGDYPTAKKNLEECVRLERKLGSTRRVAEATAFLATIEEMARHPS